MSNDYRDHQSASDFFKKNDIKIKTEPHYAPVHERVKDGEMAEIVKLIIEGDLLAAYKAVKLLPGHFEKTLDAIAEEGIKRDIGI